jgi:hypothetical protein
MSSESDLWKYFGNEFEQRAYEEEGIERAARKDRLLRAHCDYKKHPEIWAEKGKPGQGFFCLLEAPETGLWMLSDGVNENFLERFRTLAARAGRALGPPKGSDAEDIWLHRLYRDLLEHNSDQLFAASDEGGMIRRVCVASATLCARLERKAITDAAIEDSKREAFIDRAIASRKRMLEGFDMPWGSPHVNTSVLDAQKSRSLLGIELSDLENLRRAVWIKFFDEASLPRAVEVEWEQVLSSRRVPDSNVDLALTFALTRVYEKAVSRACSELADLLATATVSCISQTHCREAIWKECLDFAYQLGQWDIFATWVDRVAGIRWEAPVTADGATDREQLEKALKPRREFFESRIGMYSQEWLSAIDRAIELRRTVSAAHTANASKSAKIDPEVAKRGALVKANSGVPAAEMCEIFDRRSVPLPAKWRAAGFQSWSRTYKNSNYRSRIDTLISKARLKN